MYAMQIELSHLDSPVGPLALAIEGGKLRELSFSTEAELQERLTASHSEAELRHGSGGEPMKRLRAYFAGDLHALDDIEVSLEGTPFQRRVWAQLQKIPVGQTISYLQLATAIGKPKAVRAVGAANGRNPVALVVPCHRVIAADGKLQGYGGGLDRKAWLLRHERALLS
jgi:methylated-DNA-[protein]-cysteine S-methyltransferase